MAKKTVIEETDDFTEETEGFTKETEGFESKLESAKKVLETLMNPEITLAESVKAYETGMSELAEAQKILEEAQIKINIIKAKP